MYSSGHAGNLEKRIRQLLEDSSDYSEYYAEAESYVSIVSYNQYNKWVREFFKKGFSETPTPPPSDESLILTENEDYIISEGGDSILV